MLLLGVPGAAAQAPFQVPDSGRMRVVTRALGWTILRFGLGVAGFATAASQPSPGGTTSIATTAEHAAFACAHCACSSHCLVAGFSVFGDSAATHPALWPFRCGALPAAEHLRLAGLPGDVLEARATGQPSGVPVVVRAICLYVQERSWLLIPTAPAAGWPALEPALAAMLEGFRPG